MNPVRKLLAVAGAGLLAAYLSPTSLGQASSRPRSSLNITEPTEVPGGVVLQPGNYMIKVTDNQSNWNVITITDPSEQKVFATILATPHTATDAAPHSMFVYFETPPGQTKAIRSWWPPNDRWGQDFVYSKERAAELTKGTSEKVPEMTAEMNQYEESHRADTSSTTTSTDTSSSTTTAQNAPPDTSHSNAYSSTTTPPDTTAQSTTAQDTTAQNTAGSTWRSDSGTSTSNDTTSTTTTASNDTGTERRLPKTASPFPLLALAGLGSLGLGLAVRRYAA